MWRHSISKRLQQKVTAIGQQLKAIRSQPLTEQGQWLRSVVRGWMNYHAIPSNSVAISRFRELVINAWHQALNRRSQYAKRLNWNRMRSIADYWIAPARILHPYPNCRPCATT